MLTKRRVVVGLDPGVERRTPAPVRDVRQPGHPLPRGLQQDLARRLRRPGSSPLRRQELDGQNRDVVPSTDPREIEEQEGFDVLRCRVDLAEDTQSRDDGPLARRALTGDNCGGLDQNIYGSSLLLP